MISIKDPAIAGLSRSLNQTIVHETIELLIHDQVRKRSTPGEAKEAIVDHYCSCDELQVVYGKYRKQGPPFAGPLPDDWRSYISWQPGKAPNWS